MDVHNRKGPRQNGPRLPRTDQHQIALGQRVARRFSLWLRQVAAGTRDGSRKGKPGRAVIEKLLFASVRHPSNMGHVATLRGPNVSGADDSMTTTDLRETLVRWHF